MSNDLTVKTKLPDYLTEHTTDLGTELMQEFVVPPRVKIVQKQSGSPFTDQFATGDVIAVPMMQLLAKFDKEKGGETLGFVPIFFYPEWCKWNPIELKGSGNAIVERTFDSRSTLAAKAKNPDLWREPHPDNPKLFQRNVEHLNFVCVLINESDFQGLPVIFSFARGEHRTGSGLATLIKMRRAHTCACQFVAQVPKTPRKNQKGDWFGFNITNPPADSGVAPFVQEKVIFEDYLAQHKAMRDAHAAGLLVVEHDDDPEDAAAAAAESQFSG